MRFAWNRATADDSSPEPPAAEHVPSPDLAPVELLLSDGRVRAGWIDTGGQRTSDWLNARREVAVAGLADAATAASPSTRPSTPPEDLEVGRIVWVVPPPLPPNRHLRLHRRRVLVHLELDDHEISGQVHVRPGADAIDQTLRGTRDLVPLTEVQVVSRSNPDEGMALPVLIVNRMHVRRVVEDDPHVSAPVPDPKPSPDGVIDPRIALLMRGAEPEATGAPDAVPEVTADPAPTPATSEAAVAEPPPADGPSGIEMLNAALALLLESGVIDVGEFQSIRGRIPHPPA